MLGEGAEQPKQTEVRFKTGVVFPADDPIAQWVMVLSMGLNDSLLAFYTFSSDSAEPHERTYQWRLLGSHLLELLEHFQRSESTSEVKEFIDSLSDEAHQFYQGARDIVFRSGDSKTEFGSQLSRMRHNMFHYSRPRDKHRRELRNALEKVSGEEGVLRFSQDPSNLRCLFADPVAAVLMFPDIDLEDPQPFEEFTKRIRDLFLHAFNFSQRAIWHFIDQHRHELLRDINVDQPGEQQL